MNIRLRLTFQFIALVTAIMILFSVGVYFFSKLYLEKRFYKRLQNSAVTTATLLFEIQAADTTVLKLVNISDKEILHDESVSVYSQAEHKIVFSTNQGNTIVHEQVLPKVTATQASSYLEAGAYQIFGMSVQFKGVNYWIIVSAVDEAGKEALSDLRKILMVMTLVAILLVGLSGWIFADKALAPMSAITRQVNSIFPKNIGKRVEHPDREDEIGLLVDTFNRLLDRVEQTLLTQKIFIANVSHELKNPLTKIFSQLEITLLQPRSVEVYQKLLSSLKDDTRTLTQLTNTLLDLANTVVDSKAIAKASVRMDELLWDAKSQVQKWHENYQVNISFHDFPEEEDALVVNGNEAALKVVLMNLIDNACKFSANNTVNVDFSTSSNWINLSFFNDGPPIPVKDLPNIFEPFYRSNATAQSVKGHGVGLTIVHRITQLHNGQITVDSSSEGTTFRVSFPNILMPVTLSDL
ncbi:ATP-binding protein [Flectobacillus longus]|uniref:ATP-binding protein n=1 Tax=Flectobacillus longus TaxID=2984207 RepID=UPI0024B86C1A|nr:ATP-binding protein [Flectobacillus longus]MDI9878672.1 ATP-binding protein [Flectobacillus longus]